VVPGMFFPDEFGGSARIRFWGKIMIYLLGLWYFCYGMFLYFNLPRVDGVVDTANLVWIQKVIYDTFTNRTTLIVLAGLWAVMAEVVSRLKIIPGRLYLTEVTKFFRKMDTPVNVAAELGEDLASAEADLSSFKILGVVMVLIAVMMSLFFLTSLGLAYFSASKAEPEVVVTGMPIKKALFGIWLGPRTEKAMQNLGKDLLGLPKK